MSYIITQDMYQSTLSPTGKMGIKYGAIFMPYLPQRGDKHGKPRGLTRRRPHTVLRLFLTDLEDAIVKISLQYRCHKILGTPWEWGPRVPIYTIGTP